MPARCVTSLPVNSSRISPIASSSISSRSLSGGQRDSITCSLSASPVPTPSRNRPPVSAAVVAAACAITTGCVRTRGQVTAVAMGRDVASASAPITDQTNGDCPCSSSQGWKWSEIHRASKPARSAALAWRTSSWGPCSSQDRK